MSKAVSPTAIWNAADYAANSVVQQAWARELIARLKLCGDERILDVGCGDGKVTAEIAQAVPRGAVIGIDASPQMIQFAQKTFPPSAVSNLKFEISDARKIGMLVEFPQPGGVRASVRSSGAPERGLQRTSAVPFDIVFSSAALHWVDDHEAILRGAASVLKPGGRLIISCGGKGNAQDVFVALRPEMRTRRWRRFFRRMPKPYFLYSPANYEKWLPRSGFKALQVGLVPKDATYAGHQGFAAWLRTTWLPYVQRLPEHLREEFIAAVANRYVTRHPPDTAGRIHVRMVRLEIEAVRDGICPIRQ
ncbi:MAG TPA: methyltransferase domain-containing protein [Candidatus Sulfopaludibacter sp.]|nr:methyltransferase domain-containing protein [Candidatus Sulfopaludibacter sp.]